MRPEFKERIALYMIFGLFFFSVLFVGLWIFTPEFSATGTILVGSVLAPFVSVLMGLVGVDIVQRARSEGNGAPPPTAPRTPDKEDG